MEMDTDRDQSVVRGRVSRIHVNPPACVRAMKITELLPHTPMFMFYILEGHGSAGNAVLRHSSPLDLVVLDLVVMQERGLMQFLTGD